MTIPIRLARINRKQWLTSARSNGDTSIEQLLQQLIWITHEMKTSICTRFGDKEESARKNKLFRKWRKDWTHSTRASMVKGKGWGRRRKGEERDREDERKRIRRGTSGRLGPVVLWQVHTHTVYTHTYIAFPRAIWSGSSLMRARRNIMRHRTR